MRKQGFTLLELLVVVAIIAILVAIAVPNFLEAQTRSKLTRAQSDMRSLLIGLAAYSLDHHKLPSNKATSPIIGQSPLFLLSTPISYLTSIPDDVFYTEGKNYPGDPELPTYGYMDMVQITNLNLIDIEEIWEERFFLVSRGPNGIWEANDIVDGELLSQEVVYNPIRGVISDGDIFMNFSGQMTGGHALQNSDIDHGDEDD